MKLSDERVAIEHAQAIIKNLDQAHSVVLSRSE
jgi:hypothetical protein